MEGAVREIRVVLFRKSNFSEDGVESKLRAALEKAEDVKRRRAGVYEELRRLDEELVVRMQKVDALKRQRSEGEALLEATSEELAITVLKKVGKRKAENERLSSGKRRTATLRIGNDEFVAAQHLVNMGFHPQATVGGP